MSEDRENKAAKRRPLLPPFAEQGIAPSPFFSMLGNVPTGSEVVVPQDHPLNEQQLRPSPQQATSLADHRIGQTPDQQPQVPPQQQLSRQPGLVGQDREQLQRLCRHLRRTGRCPGECVLSHARQNRRLRDFPGMG